MEAQTLMEVVKRGDKWREHTAKPPLTECLYVPIVGPTSRSDLGYVRLSVRPVGQTGRTDCSRTAHICQSNQCGLLAD